MKIFQRIPMVIGAMKLTTAIYCNCLPQNQMPGNLVSYSQMAAFPDSNQRGPV